MACAERPAGEPTGSAASELAGDSPRSARRVRLERLASVDALARLYLGHGLKRDELLALDATSEEGVIAALKARPDFRQQYATRLGTFGATEGKGASSNVVDPRAPIADVFGEPKDAERFARWLVWTLAPAAADDVLAKHDAVLGQMTYDELLDAVRAGAAARRGS
ncbi:MAG: hypothetical protein KIT84_08980 [Labilithrix sp.]|nr:hypothetical protein [Labilithrix sp.]MCW5811133.1 hypothetical protein [Labilithrix sp.]